MTGTILGNPGATDRTLDSAEVDRFGKLAAKWWDPAGAFRPLHALGPARLAFVRREVVRHFSRPDRGLRPFSGLTMLDVGCGGGLITEPLARLGGRATGLDPAPDNIAAARAHAAAQGLAVDYRAGRIEELAATGEHFDVVVCLEVLEHVPDPAAFVRLLAAVTRPGGLVVLSTINRTRAAYALAIVGAEQVLLWLPPGTHQWDRFITPDELARFSADAGLVPGPAQGLVYDALTGEWRLGSNTGINYLLAAARA